MNLAVPARGANLSHQTQRGDGTVADDIALLAIVAAIDRIPMPSSTFRIVFVSPNAGTNE